MSLSFLKRKKKKGFILLHSLRVQSAVVGKAQQQECEVSGHMVSVIRKWKETNVGTQIS